MASIKRFLPTWLLLCCLANKLQSQTLEKLAEISTGFGNSNPYAFTVANGKIFFIAMNDAYQNGLYVSSGTEASTQKISPATIVNGSISNLVEYKGKLYFAANDGINGNELWTSDGTAAGTVLFKDLVPGSEGSFVQAFTVANGKLFFMGSSAVAERRLYVTDGTLGGTIITKDNYVSLFNGFSNFAVYNNEVYFSSDDGTGSGSGMWKSNGTPAGTKLVKGSFLAGVSGSNYAILNNKMYFSGFDYTNGSELWVTDGTDAGTHIVINLAPDNGGILYGGQPYALTVFNSKLYFSGGDGVHGQELFVTDGTAAGTHLVKDIIPGADGGNPSQIVIMNGTMYLTAQTYHELWKSDGTEAGTQLVKYIENFGTIGAVWNSKLYITFNSSQYLWQSDGTTAGTGYAKAENSNDLIANFGAYTVFTEYNSALYFGGSCGSISPSVEPLRFVTATVIHNFSFTGSGNWSNPANWAGGAVPPSTLMAGDVVVINGNCILDISLQAKAGSSITVAAGKSLVINGSLTIL